MTWTFTIPGQPVTWERVTPGQNGRRTVRTAKTRNHERTVHALATMAGVRAGSGPCRVTVEAYFSDLRGRDLDNVGKAILDGLTGGHVLSDDRWTVVRELVVRGELDKLNPRTVVTVEMMEG